MNRQKQRAWQALDIGPVWVARASGTRRPAGPPAPVGERTGDTGTRAIMRPNPTLDELRGQVAACRACALCDSRTNPVFGTGDPNARWLVIGEAPGAEEDRRGEPFVGKAGRLLDAMLTAVGIGRKNGAYIANVLKCRPPANRDPKPEEIAQCAPFLRQQVELLAPELILVVGRFAAQTLLGTQQSIGRLRGTVHEYELGGRTIPVVVTYHPAYLLRDRHQDKAQVWQDLCLARSLLRQAGPDDEPPLPNADN